MNENELTLNGIEYKAQVVRQGIVSDGCEGCDLKDLFPKGGCSGRQPSCFCKVDGITLVTRSDYNSIIWKRKI